MDGTLSTFKQSLLANSGPALPVIGFTSATTDLPCGPIGPGTLPLMAQTVLIGCGVLAIREALPAFHTPAEPSPPPWAWGRGLFLAGCFLLSLPMAEGIGKRLQRCCTAGAAIHEPRPDRRTLHRPPATAHGLLSDAQNQASPDKMNCPTQHDHHDQPAFSVVIPVRNGRDGLYVGSPGWRCCSGRSPILSCCS